MRKVKMQAKIMKMKMRAAELEMDDNDDDNYDKGIELEHKEGELALRVGELDKGLERSQGLCECAAYMFLRNGDCSMEIGNIKKKLAEVKEKAEKEIERLEGEEKK
jgi:hypothetical protein